MTGVQTCALPIYEGSGYLVGSGYSDPEAALAAVMECAPLADWTVSVEGGEMKLPPAVIERIDAIVRRWGGDGVVVKRHSDGKATAA